MILSGRRVEIQRRLGRPPTGEDHALRIFWIEAGPQVIGAVLTRRIRGEAGVIELVLAVNPEGSVIGARLQRQREPELVAGYLNSTKFLDSLRGKTAASDWKPGTDVPSAAQLSVTAVLEDARTVLILLDIAGNASSAHSHSSP